MATDSPTEIPISSADIAEAVAAGAERGVNAGITGTAQRAPATQSTGGTLDPVMSSMSQYLTLYNSVGLGDVGKLAMAEIDSYVKNFAAGIASSLLGPLDSFLVNNQAALKQTMEIASIVQGMTGMNAAAIKLASLDADNVAARMSRISYEAVSGLADAQVTLANGVKLSADSFGDAADFLSSYSDVALRDARLYNAAVDGLSTDMLVASRMAERNFGLTAHQMSVIFQRELSETGKITEESLRQYEKAAIATFKATGVPIEQINKDLGTMLNDFAHFGMMTEIQMGSLIGTVSKLGMNISDVTSLAGKFQSFDSAATAMSNLAASTGATLDTLELFELANTDQEAFIISLREQLESQGVEFEQLNFIQQKNLAAAFGLDPQVMKRFLSDNIEDITSLQGDIAQKVDLLSDAEVDAFVATMKRADQLDAEARLARRAGIKAASEDYAASLEQGFMASQKMYTEFVAASSAAVDAQIAKFEEQRKIREKFAEGSGVKLEPVNFAEPPQAAPVAAPTTAPTATPVPPVAVESGPAAAVPATGVAAPAQPPAPAPTSPAEPAAPTSQTVEIVVTVRGTDGLVQATAERVVSGPVIVGGVETRVITNNPEIPASLP